MIKVAHQRIHNEPGRYLDHLYGEKELGGTSWMYLSAVPFEQVGFDVTTGNEPIISNVKDFLEHRAHGSGDLAGAVYRLPPPGQA